jgi:hypothetical protein
MSFRNRSTKKSRHIFTKLTLLQPDDWKVQLPRESAGRAEPCNLRKERVSALFLDDGLAGFLGGELEAKAIPGFGNLDRISVFSGPILNQGDTLIL